jgi:hypothetical protein
MTAFSPSFSWPRFFPFGHGPVNEQAVQHYDDVISEMHANGITPAVTVGRPIYLSIVILIRAALPLGHASRSIR